MFISLHFSSFLFISLHYFSLHFMPVSRFRISSSLLSLIVSVLETNESVPSFEVTTLELHLFLTKFIERTNGWLDKKKKLVKLTNSLCTFLSLTPVPHTSTIQFSSLFHIVQTLHCSCNQGDGDHCEVIQSLL